ncbi:MAG: YihY/virulence factor BrkB family protein [Oscillospiraceae bacterium]|nr:YihY/virulence factor BrkB family protein [Oscillospiraceae bacterium]
MTPEKGGSPLPQWIRSIAKSWPGRFLTKTIERYFLHSVPQEAAALAYYLLFMIFPLLIFLSSLLGLLDLDISGITSSLDALLPSGVVDVVESYLSYVSQTSSRTMLWFGLVFTIYFPMRAADCLMAAVRRAYHLPRPKNQILYMMKVLLYTVFLLVTIALTLALATVGRQALEFAGRFVAVPEAFIDLWSDLRFLVLGGVMFAAVGLLYAAAQDVRQPARNIVPGALAALVGWMVVSAAFSFYVENFANYTVIYGALGTVIVLMMWLNLTAVVLIMGAEINGVLASLRGRRTPKAMERKEKQDGKSLSKGAPSVGTETI